MAFEPKPGAFSLFKNDRKEQPNHPDYKGDGLTLDGQPAWISAWLKEGKKGKFFSIAIKLKDERGGGGGGQPQRTAQPRGRDFDLDDDIPFISSEGML